jgi:nucleoside-triphosphatase
MIKNILVTGFPGCGKTTLIKEILKELKLDAGGFFTEEIREKGIRKGFKIITLDGKEGILAHVDIKSPYRISRYGVNIKDLEEIGVKSILKGIKENRIIIIDEIGKAEMLSKKFRKTVLMALNSQKKVLGTIKFTYDPFTERIKKRKDTVVFNLTKRNRNEIKRKIEELIRNHGND